jgi:hypothetical protein
MCSPAVKEVQEISLLPGELGVSPRFPNLPHDWGIEGVDYFIACHPEEEMRPKDLVEILHFVQNDMFTRGFSQ